MLDNVLTFASVLVPFITALVQLLKSVFPLPKNYVPLVGLVVGLAIGAAAYPFTPLALDVRMWAGGVAGLSAVGLFELVLNKRDGTTGNTPKGN